MMRRLLLALGLALLVACGKQDDAGPVAPQASKAEPLRVLATSDLKDLEPLAAQIEQATGVSVKFKFGGTMESTQAVLEGRATSAVAEYEIAGRQLKYISIPDLLKLRDRLRFDVQREENADRAAAGLPPKGRINVRFGA